MLSVHLCLTILASHVHHHRRPHTGRFVPPNKDGVATARVVAVSCQIWRNWVKKKIQDADLVHSLPKIRQHFAFQVHFSGHTKRKWALYDFLTFFMQESFVLWCKHVVSISYVCKHSNWYWNSDSCSIYNCHGNIKAWCQWLNKSHFERTRKLLFTLLEGKFKQWVK